LSIIIDFILNLPYISHSIDAIPDNWCSGVSIISATIDLPYDQFGNSCFSNCLKLQKIEIQSQITSFSSAMFFNCTSLNTIIIHDSQILSNGVLDLSNILSIEQQAFFNCISNTKIVFSNQSYYLEFQSMGYNPSLETIQFNQIPSSIIGSSGPFSGCMNIHTVLFPQNSNCEYFDHINFIFFTNGTNLFQFRSWCDIPSDSPELLTKGMTLLEIVFLIMRLIIGLLLIGNIICYSQYKKDITMVIQL
jgi:hypothetical protein